MAEVCLDQAVQSAARARAKGKRIGRPAIGEELQQQLVERVAEFGAYAAAKELGVDRKTAMKYHRNNL